jgi:SpoVK/Ycf46/Vps4 family AAA+-type ATPase
MIKQIFVEYKEMQEYFENTPILLFNEADAVFSRRRKALHSSDQTDNRIQTILMEELENFSGIIIGTTNIEDSFDDAYDRRFLFKVFIENPNFETRKKIWASKFPNITEREINNLATNYPLTGGQIQKISQKIDLSYVLSGAEPSFQTIKEHCEAEKHLNQRTTPIGFKR